MGAGSSTFDYEASLFADTTLQSVEVAEATQEASTSVPRRCHWAAKHGLTQGYRAKDTDPYCVTLWDLFALGHKINPQGNFLGNRCFTVATAQPEQTTEEAAAAAAAKPKNYKFSGYVERKNGSVQRGEYKFATYAEAHDAAINFGRGLLTLGAKTKDNIGIFSVNRAEWVVASLGFYSQNMRTVSLYATLGPTAVEYIINHAETAVVVVSKENLPTLLKNLKNISNTLKHIVVMDALFDGRFGNTLDTVNPADVAACAELDVKLHGMSTSIALP